MSLEEALAANTVALNKLTEMFSVVQIEHITSAQAEVALGNTASIHSTHPHVLASPSSEDAVPTAQAPVGEPVAADVIDYAAVTRAVTLAAGKKGREAVIEMFQATFGFRSAKTAKADQYPEIIAACEALMASAEEA